MATKTSTGTGNWSTSGSWSPAGKPVSGDVVIVDTGHTITIDEAVACQSILATGSIVQNYDITLDDHASAFIKIDSTGGWTSNAVFNSARVIKSASTLPTNRWYFQIYDVAGADSRTITLDFIEFRGNAPFLGNDTYVFLFNNGSTYPTINIPTPLVRTPNLTEHTVLRRATGRLYHESTNLGVVEISGTIPFTSWYYITLKNTISSMQRLAFTSHFVHLPKCRIDRYSLRPRNGGLYLDYNITLREDV